MRKSKLDDLGNARAEPGSSEWVKAILVEISCRLKQLDHDAASIGWRLKTIKEHKAWQSLGLISFGLLCSKELRINEQLAESLIHAKAGQTVGDVIARAESAEPLAEHRRPTAEEQGNKVNNINLKPANKTGPTAEYLTRRIARDRPDILERMKAGEFPSVRQAALEAGIVKPSFQCPLDPERAARLIRKHFTDIQVATLKDLL